MKNSDDDEKPELFWIEDLVEKAILIVGDVVVGIALAVVAFAKWLSRLLYDDTPSSPE